MSTSETTLRSFAEINQSLEAVLKTIQEHGLQMEKMNRETEQQIKEMNRETEQQIKEMNRETDQQIKEMIRETDRQMKEMNRETDRKFQETDRKFQETDRFLKRLGKQLGGLHRRFGDMAEHLVAPGIADRFNELGGYKFDSVSPGGVELRNDRGELTTQIDLLLENTTTIIAVEIKATVHSKYIPHHEKCLKILSEYRRKHDDHRKIYGAIAGVIFPQDLQKEVLEAGFFVITQSGHAIHINVPKDFKPRIF